MRKNYIKDLCLGTALAGCLLVTDGLASAAFAQTSDDEIIVTATRRSTSIQEVPIAVTAISGDALTKAGVDDLSTLARVAPSFNIEGAQSSATTFTFRIRGVGTTGQNVGFESSVGVFLDGVYLSRPGVALGDLVDIETFEVLRGPQGTLFGRNTSAGALNVSTKKPELDNFGGWASAGLGNYNMHKLQGAVNIPIWDGNSAFRFTGSYNGRDGTFSSTAGGESHDRDRFSLRGQFYTEPNDNLDIRIIADYAESNEVCCDSVIIQDTPLADAQASLGGLSFYGLTGLPNNGGVGLSGDTAIDQRVTAAEEFQDDTNQWSLTAELNYDLGFGTLTYIPSYRDFESTVTSYPDFTGIDVYAVQRPDGSPGQIVGYETMSHEARIQGEAMDGKLDWLVGAYYMDEDISFESTFTLGDAFQQNTSALILAAAAAADPVNFPAFLGFYGNNPALTFANGVSADGDYATNLFTQNTENFALFTHNIFSVTDKLDLTVGLRYTDETKTGGFDQLASGGSSCLSTLANANAGNIPAALAPIAIGFGCFPFAVTADLPGSGAGGVLPTPVTYQSKFSDDEFVYTANAAYKFSPDVNAYASYTRGYKSGGINLDPTAAILGADPIFNSEKVDAFEVGLKSTLMDGRLRANLAVFHSDIQDLQVLQFTGVQFQAFNVPKSKTSGVELESQFSVTDALSLSGAVTYADARYPSDCATGATAAAQAAGVQLLCGQQLTAAPKWSSNLGANYERTLGNNMRIFANGNLRLESSHRTRTFPEALDNEDSSSKIDLRIGIGSDDRRWTLEGWVQNLTEEDTRNITFAVPLRGAFQFGAVGAFYEEPRLYGATLRSEF